MEKVVRRIVKPIFFNPNPQVMMLKVKHLFVLCAAILFLNSAFLVLNSPVSDVKKKPIKLFNGKDLTGWKINGTEKWYVESGELICESGPDKKYGYLTTDKFYKNFDLSLKFKQESNGNSGVFFRSTVTGTKVSGWQVEVAPPNHDTGGVYESYGREWLVKIPDEKEGFLKMGEWNTLRIRVDGDKVQTWLNGNEMVNFSDAKIGAADGSIALQIHDGGGIKVRWKDILIEQL